MNGLPVSLANDPRFIYECPRYFDFAAANEEQDGDRSDFFQSSHPKHEAATNVTMAQNNKSSNVAGIKNTLPARVQPGSNMGSSDDSDSSTDSSEWNTDEEERHLDEDLQRCDVYVLSERETTEEEEEEEEEKYEAAAVKISSNKPVRPMRNAAAKPALGGVRKLAARRGRKRKQPAAVPSDTSDLSEATMLSDKEVLDAISLHNARLKQRRLQSTGRVTRSTVSRRRMRDPSTPRTTETEAPVLKALPKNTIVLSKKKARKMKGAQRVTLKQVQFTAAPGAKAKKKVRTAKPARTQSERKKVSTRSRFRLKTRNSIK
jgi:hypothetical protein